MKIRFLGHASFIIEDKVNVAFDPYEISTKDKMDYIFITHSHYDHCSPLDVDALSDPAKTVIIAPADCRGKVSHLGREFVEVTPGHEYNPGIKFKTIPAYNQNKDFHPRKARWVGYFIYLSQTLYHCGDTDFIDEMNGLAPDVMFVPVGGTYTMDAREAVQALEAAGAKKGIPMHYGSVAGSVDDAVTFQKLSPVPVDILKAE